MKGFWKTSCEPNTCPSAGSGVLGLCPWLVLRGPGNPCSECSVVSDSLWLQWTVARQAPLSIGFPRQESWSGLPFTRPWDLSNPGIEIMSPALAGGFFATWEALGFLAVICRRTNICVFHLWAKQGFAFTSCLKGFRTPKRLSSTFWDSGGWLHWNRDTGGKRGPSSSHRWFRIKSLDQLQVPRRWWWCSVFKYLMSFLTSPLERGFLASGYMVSFKKKIFFFNFLAIPHGMWDLSSMTRDGTSIPWSGSVKSLLLDQQGSPQHQV